MSMSTCRGSTTQHETMLPPGTPSRKAALLLLAVVSQPSKLASSPCRVLAGQSQRQLRFVTRTGGN